MDPCHCLRVANEGSVDTSSARGASVDRCSGAPAQAAIPGPRPGSSDSEFALSPGGGRELSADGHGRPSAGKAHRGGAGRVEGAQE